MATKLFVGGLAWETTEDALRNLFSQAGQVVSVTVITDRFSGRSRGFGFVEMGSEADSAAAIQKFNGFELDGRKIIVNEAKPRPEGGERPSSNRDFPARGGSNRGGRGGFSRGGNRGGGRYR